MEPVRGSNGLERALLLRHSQKIKIAIATKGRRDILRDVLLWLNHQTRLPDAVLICPAGQEDVDLDSLSSLKYTCEIINSTMTGLTNQRNQILQCIEPEDIVLFIDDDFVPEITYLENCISYFDSDSSAVMLTGSVIADGAQSQGIAFQDAIRMVQDPNAQKMDKVEPIHNGYGCNMAFRAGPVLDNGIRFDERLPLYGWLEDVDFSRQLARFGRVMLVKRCRGVHLGTKVGRISGLRFGYSQVANPLYLANKGTLSYPRALTLMSKNLAANLVKTLRPEPWVDRKGRAIGNVLAFRDLCLGSLGPEKIEQLR